MGLTFSSFSKHSLVLTLANKIIYCKTLVVSLHGTEIIKRVSSARYIFLKVKLKNKLFEATPRCLIRSTFILLWIAYIHIQSLKSSFLQKMTIILVLLAYYASPTVAVAYGNQPYVRYFSKDFFYFLNIQEIYSKGINHTIGCSKIAGISQLPLTAVNVCDTRGPCEIISEGAKCVSTSLDRTFARFAPKSYPILTCITKNCSADSVKNKQFNVTRACALICISYFLF